MIDIVALFNFFQPTQKEDIMKYSSNKQLSILPENCTIRDIEAATIEVIHRSFNSGIPYPDEIFTAMAKELALQVIL